MSISVNWATKVIFVPQNYLSLVSGSVYELDTNQFRLDLKALEASSEGMPFDDTHAHNTQVTVGGVTLARVVEIINGYTITFEDGQYAVNLVGSNSNIAENVNVNQVSIRPQNSAGLISVTSGSGVTEQDKLDIANRVWAETITGITTGDRLVALQAALDSANSTLTAVEVWNYIIDTGKSQTAGEKLKKISTKSQDLALG